MGVQQKKVASQDLEIGMFVSDLDRPWHQTPFPIQGFYIRTQDDVRAVSSHCKWVKIDVAETRDTSSFEHSKLAAFTRRPSRRQDAEVVQLPPLHIKEPVSYQTETTLKKELKSAAPLIHDAEVALEGVLASVRAGHIPDVQPLIGVVRLMTASVIRNQDAMLWLARTRKHDNYTYWHALNSAVWGLVCGRHLGLNEGLLNHLGMGCMLAHIGKAQLPEELLRNEQTLVAEDYALYQSYVDRGVALLEGSGISRVVLGIVQNHRERHNGTGFPQKIRGDRIPLLARIAGLVECYETMIEPREGMVPLTPAQAVGRLFDMRNIEFQEDLVENFIQAIGIYPTGTLVELNDGQRGVIVSHSPKRRLWPKVMVMTDQQHRPLKTATIINLASYNEGRAPEEALHINGCLPSGEVDLDPERYDVTGAESRWSLSKLVGA